MKNQLAVFFLTLFISGCAEKKYKRTIKIDNCKFYVEVFTANAWGLNQEYLTDSSRFRMYIGTVDEEHDFYTYNCKDDSLYIGKVLTGNKNCRWVTTKDSLKTVLCDTEFIVRKPVSIALLKANNKFE